MQSLRMAPSGVRLFAQEFLQVALRLSHEIIGPSSSSSSPGLTSQKKKTVPFATSSPETERTKISPSISMPKEWPASFCRPGPARVEMLGQSLKEGNHVDSVGMQRPPDDARLRIGIDDGEALSGLGEILALEHAVAPPFRHADEDDQRVMMKHALAVENAGLAEIELAARQPPTNRQGKRPLR